MWLDPVVFQGLVCSIINSPEWKGEILGCNLFIKVGRVEGEIANYLIASLCPYSLAGEEPTLLNWETLLEQTP